MHTVNTTIVRCNAPGIQSRLSILVDLITVEIDEAHARGLHPIADELDRARRIVAEAAINAWRSEGGER